MIDSRSWGDTDKAQDIDPKGFIEGAWRRSQAR
jgi:hypothetical protein